MYRPKQAGKLSNDLLAERLHLQVYYQCAITPGLWGHQGRQVMFVLIVDNFGVEYVRKADAEHLQQALQQSYTVTTDWTGSKFAGIGIKWDYSKRATRTTMGRYIQNVQTRSTILIPKHLSTCHTSTNQSSMKLRSNMPRMKLTPAPSLMIQSQNE